MGYYVNPSAESFAAIVRSGIYVDKSGLIAYMNKVVQTDLKQTEKIWKIICGEDACGVLLKRCGCKRHFSKS